MVEQLTFTEDEVSKVANFIKLVYNTAEFTVKGPELTRIQQGFNDMHSHVKKMEEHIFEVKKHHKAPAKKKADLHQSHGKQRRRL